MKFNSDYLKKILFAVCIKTPFLLFSQDVSYSLHDAKGIPLDQKLVEIMNFRDGVFVEAGAYDGITQSNTKRLEEYYGWKGILVEPSEVLFTSLCKNRPQSLCYSCALGSFEQDNTYIKGDFDGKLMSSVNGSRLHRSSTNKVLVRTLQSILDEVNMNHIHLLSLDVEGYELQVLQGIDFNRTTFDYLLIEIYSHQYNEIVNFLLKNGYDLLENFSNYNPSYGSDWDGTHNDYLFKRQCIN